MRGKGGSTMSWKLKLAAIGLAFASATGFALYESSCGCDVCECGDACPCSLGG